MRKSDNNRIARACGATIVNQTDEIKESDIGVGCGLFEVRKVGDEYFTFIEECENPKACTILLRGASKDILMEVERNLQDAMHAARNILLDPRLVPGGGATEMELSVRLTEKAKSIEGISQWPFRAVTRALEVIPRTLIQNCGGNTIRTLTQLRVRTLFLFCVARCAVIPACMLNPAGPCSDTNKTFSRCSQLFV